MRAALGEYQRREAKNTAFDTMPELMHKLYPIGKRDEPMCGYDPPTCGPSFEGWYASKVQSCRNTGLGVQTASRPSSSKAASHNQLTLPDYVQAAIFTDRYRNSNARRDPITLQFLPNRKPHEEKANDMKIPARKRKQNVPAGHRKLARYVGPATAAPDGIDEYDNDPDWP
jgi:hypothetical protein